MKPVFLIIFLGIFISCGTMQKSNGSFADVKSIDLLIDFSRKIPGPFTEIIIGGKNYQAFIDTGNTVDTIRISDEIIALYDLSPTGEQRSMTTSGEVINKQYILPEFAIPNVKVFENTKCTQMPDKNYAPNEKPDVILGLSAFDDYNILIAYDDEKIYLYEKNNTNDFLNNWVEIDLIHDKYGLYFYGYVNNINEEYLFYLDTGTFVRVRGQLYDQVLNPQLSAKLANTDEETIFILGGEEVYNNKVYTVRSGGNTNVDVFLGLNFLLTHEVFIDLRNKKLYVKK